MKNIALIPMRGGSKSIPQKNIKQLAGQPLCYWSICAALNSGIFDVIFISTDAQYIIDVVESRFHKETNAGQIVIEIRPKELALDETSTEDVIFHHMLDKKFENFCLIQATSPLLTEIDLRRGYEKFLNGYDSLLSVARTKNFFWSKGGVSLNYDYKKRPRRQDFEGQLAENGAFYFSTYKSLMETRNRLGGKIGVYEMAPETLFEIDEPSDFFIIENLMKNRERTFSNTKDEIDVVVIDVDGTLTDGGMYYGAKGEALKKFNTQDAHGISMVRALGKKILILTAENSKAVDARVKKMKVDWYLSGVKDKENILKKFAKEKDFSLKKTLYIGDDLGDYEAMNLCQFKACPQNAVSKIKQIVDFCSGYSGGMGAVRDVLERYVFD